MDGGAENRGTTNIAWRHHGPAHEEALARLEYVHGAQHAVSLLTGPAGTGKSMLAATFVDRSTRRGVTAMRLDVTGVAAEELPQLVADALRIDIRTGTGWRAVRDEVAARVATARAAVLVLDHADTLSAEGRTAVRRLSRIVPEAARGLGLVLVGRRFDDPSEWGDAGDGLAIALSPLDESESRDLLWAYVAAFGGDVALDDDVLHTLHRQSSGLPGRLVRTIDVARLAAEARRHPRITSRVVESAGHELIR